MVRIAPLSLRTVVRCAMAPVARFGALLLLISCSFASALYDAKSPILQVTDADYKSKLKGFALLELYAPCVPLRRCCVRKQAEPHS